MSLRQAGRGSQGRGSRSAARAVIDRFGPPPKRIATLRPSNIAGFDPALMKSRGLICPPPVTDDAKIGFNSK